MDWQIIQVPQSITRRHMGDAKSRRVAIAETMACGKRMKLNPAVDRAVRVRNF